MSLASLRVSRLDLLRDRAQMLGAARQFFAERGVLEVDTAALSVVAQVDAHIDLIGCTVNGQHQYLASSPEYRMKELLVAGAGDIYQLSHVFRDNEVGSRHCPEFTMVEWYRVGYSLEELIDETVEFLELFVGERCVERYTYREVFESFAGERSGDEDLLFATVVEPALPQEKICVLCDFPVSDAALAQVKGGVAERFELFCGGLELANGYHELRDPKEHRRRFEVANRKRTEALPIDESFLETLERGLPDCCGVSVGFDRLMMARHGVASIAEILA